MDSGLELHQGGNGGWSLRHDVNIDGLLTDSSSMLNGIVQWINAILPSSELPLEASEEDLQAFLLDGAVLCQILNKLTPGSVELGGSLGPPYDNVKAFLSALEKMGLPGFEVSDLEQGSMEGVLQCLHSLRSSFTVDNADREATRNYSRKRWNLPEADCTDEIQHSKGDAHLSTKFGRDKRWNSWDSKLQTASRNTAMSDVHDVGTKFNEVFHSKKGSYPDASAAQISDLIKWNSLDKAPMQFLFSMVDKVLDESFEKKSGDVSHRVALLLKKLVREIECRISSQADKIKSQNHLCKARESKYQSRVRVLETLAVGTAEENELVKNHLRHMKMEKTKLEEKKQRDQHDVNRLIRERDQYDAEIVALKQELEVTKNSYEKRYLELETQARKTKTELEKKFEDSEFLLKDTNNKMKELESISESKIQQLRRKELQYQNFVHCLLRAIQGLRVDLDSVRREVLKTQKHYPMEFQHLGMELRELVDAAENYHIVLTENRRLYNEVQDLKGNIRVYCRIRPFLPGQNGKQTTVEYIGENGELVVTNPLKQGKDSRRLFKFNKVFAPTVSQEEVFNDTQPLIRSVLDGYNVCIFAYGQTGSGKTYTMTGPDASSTKDWGVNYRALHDLFHISRSRKSSILYEVGVQMVEIYNEQVRDLLSSNGPQKRLGIWSTAQPNGLAVPEASMHPVMSTSDVLELMNIGLMNRAVGATALNERSSRSHSILTVHVRGTDMKSNSVLRGCLHLVDLAGSERVDRSEATGDRLREAQHINKSLSALGDVIFALAQKSSHVPYRNSKLTQVLQSSLGGQAKTLMFVQLNPDVESYAETVSTLKFAERVSGVELGAARSNKEGRDVRELMEQVTLLKENIAKKAEEIERLRLVKVNANTHKRGMSSARVVPSSPRSHSIGPSRQLRRMSRGKSSENLKKSASDQDNCSEYSDKHSEAGSLQSVDELGQQKDSSQPLDLFALNVGQNFNDDADLLGFGDADSEERLSDISDSGLSMGTETDGSIGSVVEYTLFPEGAKPADNTEKSTSSLPSKIPRPPQKLLQSSQSSLSSRTSSKLVSSAKKVAATSSSATKPKLKSVKRWT